MTSGNRRRAYAPRVAPEQRREQLLDAALDLVVTRGHDAATVEAVAARAGVTKPVLYGVFAGRADLLAALLARETGRALAQLSEVLTAAPPPTAEAELGPVVARMLEEFLGAVRAAPQRWHCIVMPMPGMPAEFHGARDRARDRVLAQVGEIVEGGVAAGLLPRGLDVELAAHAVVTLGEGAARLTVVDPDAHPPARFAAAARAVLGGGVAGWVRPGPR